MARKIVIDVEARFNDQVTDDAKSASDSVENLGKKAKEAGKETDRLGKKKAKPTFDAENSKFIKKIRDAESKARAFGKTKTATILDAVDKASSKIGSATAKARSFGGRIWTATVDAKDKASSILSKVSTLARGVAGKTWSSIVKIKDYATTPLKKIKDALFSIKGLVAAVTAGFAAKKLVMDPIGLADSYSSAKIGFQTLLGESEGQKMMDDLDQFAKATPFGTSQVIAQSQKMLAMGWNADDILTDLKTIGDAAAATGKGEEGLQRITLALSQIKSKGKLSTEELNQLAEAGISAKRYLAEGLGYGTGDEGLAKMTKDLERGAIGAEKAIATIVEGMKEYDGMMDKTANETVSGLWSQLQDTFEINILRKWGQGLQDGAKRGLGSVVGLLDTADGALKKLGDTVYAVGKALSNWAADKLEKAVKTIKEVTNSDVFKQASLGGKIKILWNEVVAEPFSEWWNAKGKKKIAEIAGSIGKTIGTGITGGLLVLLGIDATKALGDGVSIGGSFMEGFLEGFDTSKITKALKEWASENKLLATTIGVTLGIKLLSGIGSVVGNIKGLFGKGSGGAGGLGGIGSYSAAQMDVTAAVVNVYGFTGGSGGTGGAWKPTTNPQLPAPSSVPKLPGAAGAGGAGGKVLTGVTLKNGTIATTSSKGVATLANLGVKLGSGAQTAGGAAAAGTAGVAGYIVGGAELIHAGVDVFKGVKASKAGDKKGAKDSFITAGTRAGMVGTGTAIGAAIGSIFPGIGTVIGGGIGAGVGGLVSLFTGEKTGKAISDSTDEGGWLNNTGKAIKGFFTETIPEKWNSFIDGADRFFTESIPEAWGKLKEKVGTFFGETIPNAWNSFWDSVGNFFTEDVPYAIGYAVGKIGIFFTETLPNAWNSFWGAVGDFFTETIPEWADTIWNDYVVPFFTESVPQFFGNLWDNIKNFFTETIPEWADTTWSGYIVPFFTESIPNFFSNLWDSIKTFFTETLPTWAETIWNDRIVPFFTETIPGFFGNLWDGIKTFFTESLPGFISGVWDSIKTFFTDTIPGWIGDVVDGAKNWAKEQIGKIKSSFGAGKAAAEGDGKGGKFRGGIVGGGSSSLESFALGGMVRGGGQYIRVAEEGTPEMIIPLGSHRRDRGLRLWAKAGQMMGVPGFATGGIIRGGLSNESSEPSIRNIQYGSAVETGGQTVLIEVGGITVEIHVDATGKENIAEAIKAQANEIAEAVAGAMADALGGQFENTPVRGGAIA